MSSLRRRRAAKVQHWTAFLLSCLEEDCGTALSAEEAAGARAALAGLVGARSRVSEVLGKADRFEAAFGEVTRRRKTVASKIPGSTVKLKISLRW